MTLGWQKRAGLLLLGPVLAVGFSAAVSSLALVLSDNSPTLAFSEMWRFGTRLDSIISMLNRAVPLYVAALAVAIGFKMNLFNIGVEGQYRIAAVVAAAAGAAVDLPAPLHVLFIVVVAAAVGGLWGAIPGVLKVTRGVHEVISTIMLNTIATGIAAYLLANWLRDKSDPDDLIIKTKDIPASGWFPTLNSVLEAFGIDVAERAPGSELAGFLVVAVLLGVGFYLLVWRTRFGFDLRASGVNPGAARASGVDPKRMVVQAMTLSGAIAGLVGISQLLGVFHRYTIDFPTGYGFTGIAVALLGRNHPVGMALGALLFGFMDRSAQILDLNAIPKEIVVIMQGVILLSVVIAYEIVHRLTQAAQVRSAAAHTRPVGAMREEQPA
jgi:simple sugar transport system permease protein